MMPNRLVNVIDSRYLDSFAGYAKSVRHAANLIEMHFDNINAFILFSKSCRYGEIEEGSIVHLSNINNVKFAKSCRSMINWKDSSETIIENNFCIIEFSSHKIVADPDSKGTINSYINRDFDTHAFTFVLTDENPVVLTVTNKDGD